MQAHHAKGVVAEDGSLKIESVPFQVGVPVEVVVTPLVKAAPKEDRYSLRGTPIVYHDPLEPVADNDWEACR